MCERRKKPTKSKIPTPQYRIRTNPNSKKTHTEEHKKKILHHSLPKNLTASQISSLGKPAWPELHYTLHPLASPAASLGQTGKRERKGL